MEKFEMVSIVIPAYNSASFIIETLDSIKNQTYTSWECIVVDDGSHDSTFSVVSDYSKSDSRFKIVKRPQEFKPGGRGAKNYGFTISKGEYIAFFDSDDVMVPEYLDKKVVELDADDSLDFVASNFYWKVSKGKPLREFSYLNESLDVNEDFWVDYLKMSFWMTPPAPLWRRTFLEEKELWDEDTRIGEDWEFHGRMLIHQPKFKIINDYLWYYMAQEESMMYDKSIESVASRAIARIKLFRVLVNENIPLQRISVVELRWQARVIRQILEVVRHPGAHISTSVLLKILKLHFSLFGEVNRNLKGNGLATVKLLLGCILFRFFGKGYSLFEFNKLGEKESIEGFSIEKTDRIY